jgi:hypothetical protein
VLLQSARAVRIAGSKRTGGFIFQPRQLVEKNTASFFLVKLLQQSSGRVVMATTMSEKIASAKSFISAGKMIR